MRKFIICLLTIFAITPAFSENYIIFKAPAVEDAINTLVPSGKRVATRNEYQKHMDKKTGKISVSGVYKVCYAAGFDVKSRGGYNDCQNFVETIIAGSQFGTGSATQKSCSEELDGVWTLSADGKQYQCLGRDGSFLVYRNACTDKKDGDTNSQCWQNTFANIYIQYAVAKSAIQQWAKEKLAGVTLTCKNMKTTNKTSDGWLYCVGNNRPYTFKFAGFGPNDSVDAERENTMALMCKLADHNYLTYSYAESANMGVGGTCLCAKCNASGNGVYPLTDLKDGISKCNQVATWGKRLGGYSAKPVNDGMAKINGAGRAPSAIRHDMCFIYGGRASTSSIVNELKGAGIDNTIFLDITVRNSEDVIEKVREYARNVLGADKVNSVECETTHRTETGAGGLFGMFDVKKADIIRCRINGKKVDFAFKDLSTMSNFRTKAGLQGFECKVQQGDYTGKECKVLSQDKCEKIKKGNAQVCPECKSVYWNAELGSCVLPNSTDAHNLDKGIKYATIVGTAAAGVAITVVSGGTAGAGAYLLVVEVAGAAIETYQTAKIDAAAQKFLDAASKCNDADCAEELIKSEFKRLSNMQNDFTETEVFEIDARFAKLFTLIPETSSVFTIEQRTLEANALPFYNPASWEPEQIWRAVGVGLQMASLFTAVINKVFLKGAPRLTNTTKVLRTKFQNALPAAKETKLLAGGDDAVKLLGKADDVPLLPGQRMTRADAKALTDIEARNGRRIAGTATDYQQGIRRAGTGKDMPTADFQRQQEIFNTGKYRNLDDMYAEAHAVMQNEAIVAKESELAKVEEHLKWLREHPAQATKGDLRSTEASVERLRQELAGMGRTYGSVADDAARAATKADDAARAATKADDAARAATKADDAARAATKADDAVDAARAAGRTAAGIDDTYKVGAKATTRAEILEKWGLKSSATDAEVTARYRELARKFHPDMAAGDAKLARELNEIMTDINKERSLLRSLPRETPYLVEDAARLAITQGDNVVTGGARAVPMIGHNIIGAAAAGRALYRALDGPDQPRASGVVGATGTGDGTSGTSGNGTGDGASGVVGGIGGTSTGGTSTGGTSTGGTGSSGTGSGVVGGGTATTNTGSGVSVGGTTTGNNTTIGGTGTGDISSGISTGTSGVQGANNNSNAGSSTGSGSEQSGKKSGISGWGAAAIGAGVAGLGVGAALLISGAGKKAETSGSAPVANANIELFNAVRERANGTIGVVNNSNVELVPIETANGLKDTIVSIDGHAVVVVKHNGNLIPFVVDTENGVTKWMPFTNVNVNTHVFNKYVPKTDIMRTAQIAEKLTAFLPPLQVQYFASPNDTGMQFVSPSMNGYTMINDNSLRYMAFNFNKNTRLGVFLFG